LNFVDFSIKTILRFYESSKKMQIYYNLNLIKLRFVLSKKDKRKLAVESAKKQPQQQQPAKKAKNDEKAPKLVEVKPAAAAEKEKSAASQLGQQKTIQGGVIVKDLREGKGLEAKKGKTIQVYYVGRLKSNNKQFDACQSGKPFRFRLGAGEVIKGWDVGFDGMRVGGKRQIVVPPHMGYGSKRMGNDIPANSTLVFDVELKAIN
jgi:FK506-binding nuclear protein